MMSDNDCQMIFGDHGGLKLPDICLTGEEKPQKNLTQETCPDRGSNLGPLRDRHACSRLAHSGGRSAYQMKSDPVNYKSTYGVSPMGETSVFAFWKHPHKYHRKVKTFTFQGLVSLL